MTTDIAPPDYNSVVGMVRALIPDVEQVDWERDGQTSYLFTDQHLRGLLNLNAGLMQAATVNDSSFFPWDIKRAAADAISAVAVSEALISKVIKTEDLQTDGAKLANALFARAQQLRQEADKDEDDMDLKEAFTIVDFVPTRPIPMQDWNIQIASWRNLF